MHPLLLRQLKVQFGDPEAVPAELANFVHKVDEAYAKADRDFALLSRSLDEMSDELNERNDALRRERDEQASLVGRLAEAHHQLLQSEKMASVGQLAAGVAHEINNPIAFVNSNLNTLIEYVDDLLLLLDGYQAGEADLPPERRMALVQLRERIDLPFLRKDLQALMRESGEGLARVKAIVQDLKSFSHADTGVLTLADLHEGLDSTLNVATHEIKYKADVVKNYGDIPPIECLPSQLNQVFMNLVVNAAQAMNGDKRGTITVRTRPGEPGMVTIEIGDNGSGIPPENLTKIFNPFFTTKPVGEGTGLGLSLSYGIVKAHQGRIEVSSEVGHGTVFLVHLPIRRPE
ncbi:MAG: ATP-binding protein [Bacteroidota bacterium]